MQEAAEFEIGVGGILEMISYFLAQHRECQILSIGDVGRDERIKDEWNKPLTF